MKNFTGNQKGCTILFVVATLLFANSAFSQKSWDGGASTANWGDGNNWNPNGVPASGDAVTIAAGNTVVVNVNAFCATLQINNASNNTATSLTVNSGQTLAVGGGTGTVTIGNATGMGNGNVSTTSLTVNGTLNAGTIHQRPGVRTSGQGGAGSTNLTISATGTVTASNVTGTSLDGAPAGMATASVIFTGAGTLNVSGSFTTSVLTPSTGTVNYNGSAAQTAGYASYGTLKINNASGVTLGAASTVTTLTIGDITSGSNFNDGGFQLSSTGTLNLTSGTFKLGSASAATTFPSFTTRNIASGTTIEYASGVAQTIAAINYSNLTSSGAGARTLSSGTIGIAGAFTPGSNSYTITGSTINFNSSSSQTIPAFNYYNLTSSSTGARILASTGTIGIAGTFTPGSNSYTITGSTINFNGSAAQSIGSAIAFNNLTISNTASAVTTTANITAAGNLTVTSNAILSPGASNTVGGSGTLTGSGTVLVSGTGTSSDFISQYTISNKTLSSLTVEYSGSAAQNVSALSYGGLKINNTAGATLAGSTSVGNTLTLSNGLLYIPTTNTLTLTTATAIAGGSFADNKHIATQVNYSTGAKGVLQVNSISGNFTFPVGNGTYYIPATVTPIGSSNFSVTVFTGVTTNGTPNGNPTSRATLVNAVWDVTNVLNNGVSTTLTLGWPAALERSEFVEDDGRIGISHYSNGKWDDLQGLPDGDGRTATRSGLTSFSPFIVSYITAEITLPVRFMDVKAAQEAEGIQVSWSNATEEEVQNYVVERSTDGRSFTPIAELAATTNNNRRAEYVYMDRQSLEGAAYYRIRAVEKDGRATYSAVVKVSIGIAGISLNVFPNPVKENQLSFTATNLPQGLYDIRMYSATGQLLFVKSLNHKGGSVSQTLSLDGVKRGHYILELNGTVRMVRKLIVQ